jgi:hypothetical protein
MFAQAEELAADSLQFWTHVRKQAFLARCLAKSLSPAVTSERLADALRQYDTMSRVHTYLHVCCVHAFEERVMMWQHTRMRRSNHDTGEPR